MLHKTIHFEPNDEKLTGISNVVDFFGEECLQTSRRDILSAPHSTNPVLYRRIVVEVQNDSTTLCLATAIFNCFRRVISVQIS